MGKDLYDHSAAVRQLFQAASEIARKDIAKLIFEGSEADLQQTDNTQITMTVTSLSALTVLREYGIQSGECAGFSLGEYAAMVDAGVLEAEDAFRLVMQRGGIMERVSRSIDTPAGPAGMTAVLGLDLPQVQQALDKAGLAGVYPALYNSPVQTVIAGTAEALGLSVDVLKAAGARRVTPLKVSGPFHTPLMEPARVEFGAFAADTPFRDPRKPILSNVTAAPVVSGSAMRELCLKQLVSTVRWTDEERALRIGGIDLLLEVGPGSVLTTLWKAVGKVEADWPVERCRTAGTLEDIQSFIQEVAA